MEGIYMISNYGRIKALERTIMRSNGKCVHISTHFVRGSKDTKGYLQLDANIDGQRILKFVHRLVAEAFVENPKHLEQVNHKDGNKTNNHAANLEWVSCLDNIHHAWENHLNKPLQGEAHGNHKLTEEQARFIKRHYIKGDAVYGAKALAEKFNVTVTPIRLIAEGKAWKHIN